MNRQYVGARYVPKFFNNNGSNEWVSGISYEPLTIVTYLNNSYTSRMPVPSNIGTPISEDGKKFWVLTGNYNAQVEEYKTITESLVEYVKNGALFFKTFTLAKNSNLIKKGVYFITSGFYNENDGGSCLYLVVENESDVYINNNLYAKIIKTSNVINPIMYGAMGNGVSDDTEYLIKAINSELIVDGLNKEYAISSSINCNFKIQNIIINVIKDLDYVLGYDTMVEMENITINGNNKSLVGVKDIADNNPNIRHFSIFNNITVYKCNTGFYSQYVLLSYDKCYANYCDIGFDMLKSDAKHGSIVTSECGTGVSIASNIVINSIHGWNYYSEGIGIEAKENAKNITIANFFNDTLKLAIKLLPETIVTIGTVFCFRNNNAVKPTTFQFADVDKSSKCIINNLTGSFTGIADYFSVIDGLICVDNVNIFNSTYDLNHYLPTKPSNAIVTELKKLINVTFNLGTFNYENYIVIPDNINHSIRYLITAGTSSPVTINKNATVLTITSNNKIYNCNCRCNYSALNTLSSGLHETKLKAVNMDTIEATNLEFMIEIEIFK